jgi:uncharacterized protein YdeI (YjbR/CyaY-like superfamily)
VTPPAPRGDETIAFRSQAAWRTWLARHHRTSPGVWIRIARKDAGLRSVTHPEALEVALCYGWIDGIRKSHDATTFLQRFTPRRPRSVWSKINRAKALELIERGAMRPAGLAEVEKARADGRWDAAYDSYRSATVPDELRRAFDAQPKAKAFFETLGSRHRFGVIYRIQTAKKPETRSKRIAEFIRLLARRQPPF